MTLVADAAHLGTPERLWRAPGVLDTLPAWRPPACRALLVVAPHPDDEVLGAAGALLQCARAGAEARLLAVTDGEGSHPRSQVTPSALAARRRAESAEGLRRLGLTAVVQRRLALTDGGVAAAEGAVSEAIAAMAGAGDLVLAPWVADGHRDHDACGRAARAAAARTGATLVEYLVWAWHWASPAGGELPLGGAVRLPLPRRDVAAKRWATAAHRSQVRGIGSGPHDGPVLPDAMLRRAWRPFEVLLPWAGDDA
ncbi:MAG TPA: PIG-L family deacetylase [Acidimicrobiales bacterium]|nr:PIG-L family deacetylase [Acidimicrobiales bacterium]